MRQPFYLSCFLSDIQSSFVVRFFVFGLVRHDDFPFFNVLVDYCSNWMSIPSISDGFLLPISLRSVSVRLLSKALGCMSMMVVSKRNTPRTARKTQSLLKLPQRSDSWNRDSGFSVKYLSSSIKRERIRSKRKRCRLGFPVVQRLLLLS